MASTDQARRECALYLPVVAELDPSLQLDPELLARIKDAADRYAFDEAAALISDDLLYRFAIAGTPDEVAEHAAEILTRVQRVSNLVRPTALALRKACDSWAKKFCPR